MHGLIATSSQAWKHQCLDAWLTETWTLGKAGSSEHQAWKLGDRGSKLEQKIQWRQISKLGMYASAARARSFRRQLAASFEVGRGRISAGQEGWLSAGHKLGRELDKSGSLASQRARQIRIQKPSRARNLTVGRAERSAAEIAS